MSFFSKNQTKQYAIVLFFAIALVAVVFLPLTGASAIDIAEDDTIAIVSSDQKTSHRFIVQLESPALTELDSFSRAVANGTSGVQSASAQAYVSQLQAEQVTFVSQMTQALPDADVASYINENGVSVEATYQVVINAIAVDAGTENLASTRKALEAMPGVKAVFPDYAYTPTTYTSTALINAPAVWDQLGGQEAAGTGVKVASMDGGIHHEAAMFDGTGWKYPTGWPLAGLGDATNNNGKIIASRVYFRDWDPPSVGDENSWPGTQGTPHGVHTSSTIAGNIVEADYLGITTTLSGVAPGAWLMSYRVFYNSVTNNGSFYLVEGLAALEDLTMDGADVVNNSWGGGPGSAGGEFDPLDMALINASNAGVFVSMSAGNAGPDNGTTDHPSDDYINVAASTTSGTYASGRLNVTAPTPISPTLQGLSYAGASFGAAIPPGQTLPYDFVTGMSVDSGNFEGCNAWPADTFTEKAAVISRGACEFGVKVLNAENAGADFVVIYNHDDGGDELINMAGGAVGNQVTIASIFVGQTDGLNIVDWYTQYEASSSLELNTFAFQSGNTPDVIASFSSRGPGVGNVLKPDIAAPGVNILAQGYAPGASGEDRHLGYGQASGTSMASPHVAGAATLLRQLHPDWSNAYIKSAMMSTSKYMEIYNHTGTPAQPLDMGAGRLDLTNAGDPGVILDPPSLSFGLVDNLGAGSINVKVTNIADAEETYDLSTLYTGNGFAITQTTTLTGFMVSPVSITVAAGASEWFTVTFDAATSLGVGDNQGYIIMDGNNGHDAHLPAWARVTAPITADVLVYDLDASPYFYDYQEYYTSALDTLGLTYDVIDWWNDSVPHAANLVAYKAVIVFTGDFYFGENFSELERNRLTEYANSGGTLIFMGQDAAAVLESDVTDGGNFFYSSVLGGNWLQDSVTGYSLPSQPIVPYVNAPDAFANVSLNLGGWDATRVNLAGTNAVPPVASMNNGWADFTYDIINNELYYDVEINPNAAMTLTAAHIHSGTVGVNGSVVFTVTSFMTPTVITTPYAFDGSVTLTDDQQAQLFAGGFYLNVHSEAVPSGELRAQVDAAVIGDGAGNQNYIDELATVSYSEPDSPELSYPYTALFSYPGYNIEDGVVGVAHRAQPTLEIPSTTYYGRSIYTSFGLEGVNDGLMGYTDRAELMGLFMDWAMDEPAVSIMDTSDTYTDTNQMTMFEATLTSNIAGTTDVSYRWDFGDGSPYAGPYSSSIAGHSYDVCGTYKVRVEATDSLGNAVVDWMNVEATQGCTYMVYLPSIQK